MTEDRYREGRSDGLKAAALTALLVGAVSAAWQLRRPRKAEYSRSSPR